jgi:ABC-type branched-subunit amino acid transport system permease subunit
MTEPVAAVVPAPRWQPGIMLTLVVMAALLAAAPFVGIYPVFLMKALCFALFACAFNLLIGFGGLVSFGHAMFLGTAGYVCAHAAKVWGWPPEPRSWPEPAPRRARARYRITRHSPPGHLLRHDHAGAGADDLFFLLAGAVHAR